MQRKPFEAGDRVLVTPNCPELRSRYFATVVMVVGSEAWVRISPYRTIRVSLSLLFRS